MWQQQQFQMQCAVSCDSVQSSMSPRPFRIKSPVQTVTTVSRHLNVGRVEGWVEGGGGGRTGWSLRARTVPGAAPVTGHGGVGAA